MFTVDAVHVVEDDDTRWKKIKCKMMSDEPPPKDSQPQHAMEEEETYLGVVNPSPSEDTNDEAAELRAKLEKANHMIKTQNTAYQRAIRRAVLENDYVSKINSKLVQKLELQTREQGYSEKDLAEVQSICEKMKQLVTELADAKNNLLADKEALTSEVSRLREQNEKLEKENKGVSEALAVGNQSKSKDEEDASSKAALQLQSEKEELAKELLVMKLSRDEATKELDTLQKRFEDAEQANESRVAELTDAKLDAEKQVQELMSSVEKMEAEAETKEERVQEMTSIVKSTEEQNQVLIADKEALNSEMLTLRQQNEELNNLINEKETGDKLMDQKYAEVEDENKRLTKSINSLMNELILVNNDVNDSATPQDNEHEDVEKSVETKVADNLSLISALRLKLRFFRKDNEDLRKSVDEKDEKLAQMEKDLESFVTARDSDLAASASKLAAAEKAISEDREKSDVSIAERQTVSEEAERSRVRIVELEDQLSKLKELETDFVSSKTQLEEEVQILQSEKKSQEENEVNQRDQIEKLKVELADGAAKATELEESLEKERAEIQSIKNQIKTLEDQKRDVEETLLSVSNDRDELEEKCVLADEELRDLQEKLESAVGMGVAFVDKAEKYKKDVAALTTKRDAAEQLAKEYHTENEANVAKCAELEQTVASLQKELEELDKESKATIAKTTERLNKRMADCDRQLTTLLPPSHPARKNNNLKFRDMISLLQKERDSVLEKIKSLEEDVEAAQDESAILEQQVRILSKEVSKHKRQNKEILRALNEVAVGRSDEDSDIPMDEVAVDAEVEKRLGKFKQFMYGRLSE